ncbi:hypothetical protein KUTeg_022910 [Tegillarca granosa]|uniref:Alpha-D-phosphohexomutase alpha/beta/alpha domain-containing protein n=1 Tax=Tegillarca granosa TaxID=220873 RepID=A0ABQ9E140_TEGGR|nr:hypothetical protein KUTeg_022910 [Tegillarca granosa]
MTIDFSCVKTSKDISRSVLTILDNRISSQIYYYSQLSDKNMTDIGIKSAQKQYFGRQTDELINEHGWIKVLWFGHKKGLKSGVNYNVISLYVLEKEGIKCKVLSISIRYEKQNFKIDLDGGQIVKEMLKILVKMNSEIKKVNFTMNVKSNIKGLIHMQYYDYNSASGKCLFLKMEEKYSGTVVVRPSMTVPIWDMPGRKNCMLYVEK